MSRKQQTVIEQLNSDFPADEIGMDGVYLRVGNKFRAFLHVDTTDLGRNRADSNMGRNYLLFLAFPCHLPTVLSRRLN